jgi:hypothetical protein
MMTEQMCYNGRQMNARAVLPTPASVADSVSGLRSDETDMPESSTPVPSSTTKLIWSLELPPSEKYFLLTLADLYPLDGSEFELDTTLVGERTCYAYRSLQRIITALITCGIMRKVAHRRPSKDHTGFNHYTVDVTVAVTRAPGYVYFVQAGGLFKIGNTYELRQRVRQIANQLRALAGDVKLIHAIVCHNPEQMEKAMQRRFAHRHTTGEWFALTPEDVKEIQRIQEM